MTLSALRAIELPTTLTIPRTLWPLALIPLRALRGIRRFSGLAYDNDKRIGGQKLDRGSGIQMPDPLPTGTLAIPLKYILGHHSCMISGAAGHDHNFINIADVFICHAQFLNDNFTFPDTGLMVSRIAFDRLHRFLSGRSVHSLPFSGIDIPVDAGAFFSSGSSSTL